MKKIQTFIKGGAKRLKFGDFLIFQEYTAIGHNGTEHVYSISKPIMAIYLGYFVADQTIGFNYIEYINENRTLKEEKEYQGKKFTIYFNQEVGDIKQHTEWDKYIDILGHYKSKPGFREILAAFRSRVTDDQLLSSQIIWE